MTTILLKKYPFLAIITFCFAISLNFACNPAGDSSEKGETKQPETKTEKKEDLPAHCNNGLYDGDETGFDCGGSCPTDCCNNKKLDINLGEKGIDCGGKCPTNCCENEVLDPTNGETEIDCGGSCKPCSKTKKVGTALKPAAKISSPLAKDLEKDLNEIAKQSDKKERRNMGKALNKKYEGAQIIAIGKETQTYTIRDYTKNLNVLIGNKISIKVTNVQETDGKINVATITENK